MKCACRADNSRRNRLLRPRLRQNPPISVGMRLAITLLTMSSPLRFEPRPGRVARAPAAPRVSFFAIGAAGDDDSLSLFKPENGRIRSSAGHRLVRWVSHVAFCLVSLGFIAMVTVFTYLGPVETPQPSPPKSTLGVASFTSRPSGAEVMIDGSFRGATPISLSLAPGLHTVKLRDGRAERILPLTIEPGMPLSFDVEFALDSYASSDPLRVEVSRGKVANVDVAAEPQGLLSINALPWADVQVDGHSVGSTPVANLSLPIGVHEILWHHPQLGEFRSVVSVRAQSPTGISINLEGDAAGEVTTRLSAR